MLVTVSLLSLSLLSVSLPASAETYSLQDQVVGWSFFDFFQQEAIPDPTNGRVNYVDRPTAQAQNLTFASADHFILRADDVTTLAPGGPGRDSVRLISNKQFSTHVAVFDVHHMPQGCGTWPAIWELGENWPYQGEVDILEGVNDAAPNAATLHTGPDCSMPSAERSQTGAVRSLDCAGSVGCGVDAISPVSYGPAFNAAGGGWYAIERTDAFIKVWFWSRSAMNPPPDDVVRPGWTVNTDAWGTPFAYFPNTLCDIASKFGPHRILINLTFCGDWAGSVYAASGCPADCQSFVDNNPEAFADAYFDIASLRTYV